MSARNSFLVHETTSWRSEMNGGLIVLLKGYGSKRPFHGVIRSVGTRPSQALSSVFPQPLLAMPSLTLRSRLAGFFTASVLLGYSGFRYFTKTTSFRFS